MPRIPALLASAFIAAFAAAPLARAAEDVNVASYAYGTWVVKHPKEYDAKWSAPMLFDEHSASGWATPKGTVGPQEIVVELGQRSLIHALEFDTASADGPGRAAADVTVEISDESASAGFKPLANVKLAEGKDHQRFAVASAVPGRWMRITAKSNHGSPEYVELFEVRALGERLPTSPPPWSMTGTWRTNYGDFHMVQQGGVLLGCYEFNGGLVQDGGIEGRVAHFTWIQKDGRGPATLVFSPDGKRFLGLWWYEGRTNETNNPWIGERVSDTAGTCPDWKDAGSGQQALAKELEDGAKARIYGIRFDVDSDQIRGDSRPALEEIARVAKDHPDWRFEIDGHTDATASAAHNQQLSEHRAAAVKAWLVKAGITADRLSTHGYGATRPVADNATELGRAQNRRVELSRR
jgi:outer membrane protein OmpA-like peptidoglycan-associated protein